MAYCDLSDLFAYGLPRGALRNAGRLIGGVDTVANTIELDVHGLASGSVLSFRAEAGGAIPSPLVSGTRYYAVYVSESRFGVALTAGGPSIDLTTAGSRVVMIADLPEATVREWASRLVDDMLSGHVVPLEDPYPEIVRMTTAELAAGRLLTLAGLASKSLAEITDAAHARLSRWSRGALVRGASAPQSAALAASAASSYRDPRGWREFGGL
jgi:hypothetical protein